MNQLNEKIAEYFQENQENLVNELLPHTLDHLNLTYTDEDLKQHDQMLSALLERVAKSLHRTDKETNEAETGYDSEDYFYSQGVLLKNTVDVLSVFRLKLVNHLRDTELIKEARLDEGFELVEQLIFAFDAAIRQTTKNYNALKEREKEDFEQHLNSMSTPVVLIDDAQAVVPLVGEFSTERFEIVMKNTLEKVKKHNLRVIFIDFSGIATFDSVFINDIFHMTKTIQLLGTRTVLTGIQTDIATAAVEANMSFEKLETFGELRQALDIINKRK
ncbi:STAS domain-containing protein [Halobacillus yeomjeoni]|uniref:STAS domain-containing protein n=1 Tax=Halobacillus yeomjeoni TaxID=311194 RepID=A0A931MWW9_9BACI|nr:STAS domain-containing protein [Halobacillus yeomjeoni]MBH0231659.1 STAS domain-containing protein [Halobacillus yeomjeoni]